MSRLVSIISAAFELSPRRRGCRPLLAPPSALRAIFVIALVVGRPPIPYGDKGTCSPQDSRSERLERATITRVLEPSSRGAVHVELVLPPALATASTTGRDLPTAPVSPSPHGLCQTPSEVQLNSSPSGDILCLPSLPADLPTCRGSAARAGLNTASGLSSHAFGK